MDSVLKRVLDTTTPKISKIVTEGCTKEIMKTFPDFLNKIIMSGIKTLNPKIDLKYLGYRYVSAKEEYQTLFNNTNNKINFDIAPSDLYMIELMFEYEGQPLRRQLFLPYAEDGNITRISNTHYHIVPVLSDTVISPTYQHVFIRLIIDKINVERFSRNFIINGKVVAGDIIHSQILRVNKKQITDNIGNALLSISLYLAAKNGFLDVFKKYLNTTDIICTLNENVDEYKDKYNIFESTRLRPKGLKEYGYVGHGLKICIPKTIPIEGFIKNFISGIIYSFDLLPNETEDFVELYNTKNVSSEIMFWRILLGRIAYKNSYSIDRIYTDVYAHFEMLDGYLDFFSREKLANTGVYLNDFFDLLHHVLTNYNVWLRDNKEYNSNLNNRYINIDYYLLYDIIVGINKVIINLNKRITKKPISYKECAKTFANELGSRLFFGVVRSRAVNLAVMLAETTIDIKYPKITAVLEDRLVFN